MALTISQHRGNPHINHTPLLGQEPSETQR